MIMIIITIFMITIMIYYPHDNYDCTQARLPAGTLVARESSIFTLVHPALLKVDMVKIWRMDVRSR